MSHSTIVDNAVSQCWMAFLRLEENGQLDTIVKALSELNLVIAHPTVPSTIEILLNSSTSNTASSHGCPDACLPAKVLSTAIVQFQHFLLKLDKNGINEKLEAMKLIMNKIKAHLALAALLGDHNHMDLNNQMQPQAISSFMEQEDIWMKNTLPFLGIGQLVCPSWSRQQEIEPPLHRLLSHCRNPPLIEGPHGQQEPQVATSKDTFYSMAFQNVACAQYCLRNSTTLGQQLDRQGVCTTIASTGNLAVLQWAHEQQGFPLNRQTCPHAAARSGSLEVLKWLYNNNHVHIRPHHDIVIPSAVACANQKLIKWARPKFGRKIGPDDFESIIEGYLQLILWAREKNFNWDSYYSFQQVILVKGTPASAQVAWIKWAHENDFVDLNSSLSEMAAGVGNLDLLVYFQDNGGEWSTETLWCAAEHGQLACLQYANKNGCPLDDQVCVAAAFAGHLHILEWAYENKCPWSEDVCSEAANVGQLDILKWLREKGCPWDASTCTEAARNGHFNVLQWAHENECPWDASTCAEAAFGGYLVILKWARQQGCPWDASTCTNAARNGHLEVLQWALEQGCSWDYEAICEVGGIHGRTVVQQWVRRTRQLGSL